MVRDMLGALPNNKIYFLDSTLCSHRLPASVAKNYQILIIRRGGCSFNDKLSNIPAFTPSKDGLQLVVVLSPPETQKAQGEAGFSEQLIRPLLDERQKTPAGIERRYPIAMMMVEGTGESVAVLRNSASVIARVDEETGELVEEVVTAGRKMEAGKDGKVLMTGLGVKRRYWFESMGVPIANLIVL